MRTQSLMRGATSNLRARFSPSERYQLYMQPSAGEELPGVEQLVDAWRDRSQESAIGNSDWKKHMP